VPTACNRNFQSTGNYFLVFYSFFLPLDTGCYLFVATNNLIFPKAAKWYTSLCSILEEKQKYLREQYTFATSKYSTSNHFVYGLLVMKKI
jgi:hypothetical protein